MNAPLDPATMAEPTTALTVVDTTLTELQTVQAGLDDLRARFANVVHDVSTTKGMDAAKADRLAVRDVRYAVQRATKTAKDWLNGQKKVVEEKAEFIIGQVSALEEPIDATIKAEEQRREAAKAEAARLERERVERIANGIAEIRSWRSYGSSSGEIAEMIAAMTGKPPAADKFDEMLPAAQRAHDETLATLRERHAAALAHEAELQRQAEERAAEQRRIAEERAALAAERAAAKAEADRIAALQREAADRADAERRVAEQRAWAEREELARQRREFEQQQAQQAAAIAQAQAELERQRAEMDRQQQVNEAADLFAAAGADCPDEPAMTAGEVLVEPTDAPGTMLVTPVGQAESHTLKLGEISLRLGFTVTADFLARLGFEAHVERNSRLYHPSDFARICAALVEHVEAVAKDHA